MWDKIQVAPHLRVIGQLVFQCQCQISPAASPDILHHTVWRTWLYIAYSAERWLLPCAARQHTILALNWIQASRCSLTWRLILANQTTAPAHARGSPYCCVRGHSRCQRQFTQWRFLRDVLFVREFRVSFPFLAIRSNLCFCRHFLTLSEVSRVAFTKKCVWNETKVSCLTERNAELEWWASSSYVYSFSPIVSSPVLLLQTPKVWNMKP